MKAIVVVDFAYKGPQRIGRGTGRAGLKGLLKYVQYRDTRNNHLAQNRSYERWQDHGLGMHHGDILKNCSQFQSKHVLAWTWVISPAPDLMALVPPEQRRQMVSELTERVVEDYYMARGYDTPEFAFVIHDRQTEPKDGSNPQQQLHTHVILPGTVPSIAERLPVYNNKERGHDALFRDIASRHFASQLDEIVGPQWRRMREVEVEPDLPATDSLDDWFPRR
ncbi:MAG: hypothetical protein SF029_19760 [bacterium]|nr:hypothetical protein [bacterium]